MDEYISSISDAHEKYIDAVKAMHDAVTATLGEFASASISIEATVLAVRKFKQQEELFLKACDDAEGFIHNMTQQINALEMAHGTKAVDPNVVDPKPAVPAYAELREHLAQLVRWQSELREQLAPLAPLVKRLMKMKSNASNGGAP